MQKHLGNSRCCLSHSLLTGMLSQLTCSHAWTCLLWLSFSMMSRYTLRTIPPSRMTKTTDHKAWGMLDFLIILEQSSRGKKGHPPHKPGEPLTDLIGSLSRLHLYLYSHLATACFFVLDIKGYTELWKKQTASKIINKINTRKTLASGFIHDDHITLTI